MLVVVGRKIEDATGVEEHSFSADKVTLERIVEDAKKELERECFSGGKFVRSAALLM